MSCATTGRQSLGARPGLCLRDDAADERARSSRGKDKPN